VAWLLLELINLLKNIIMAVKTTNSHEETLQVISEKESAGFKTQSFEVELEASEVPYVGTCTGEFKVIDYVNTSGKGLLILLCTNVNGTPIDIPITKSKIGMFNKGMEVNLSVTRKDNVATNPKRVKFLEIKEETTVND
jgi:hypothetical protein